MVTINEAIKEKVGAYENEMINFRRELHMHPEISNEEVRTTKRISELLMEAGIEHEVLKPSGVIAQISGKFPGKTVALRADMDALTLEELNDVPYKSQIQDKMHACGHDAHTAMLLCAAKVLNDCKDQLKGTVKFFFQPAEEVAQGAKRFIEAGCMENVDNVFGLHVNPQMKTGCAAVDPGPSYAAADIMKITFHGKGGHGAMPQDTVDAVVMASAFIMNLQTIISRKTDPLQPAVITIGKMAAGTRFNIIAQTAVLDGTVRCFDIDNRDRIVELIKSYAEDTAKLYGGRAVFEYTYGTIPLINEKQSALFAQEVIKEAFGTQALCESAMTTTAEDFSYYLQHAKGAYAALGTAIAKRDVSIHHGTFDIDEQALKVGAEILSQYAYAYLSQDRF